MGKGTLSNSGSRLCEENSEACFVVKQQFILALTAHATFCRVGRETNSRGCKIYEVSSFKTRNLKVVVRFEGNLEGGSK